MAPSKQAPEEAPNMSFFTRIETDLHTFAAWAEKELGHLSTEAPAIEKVTDTVLQYVGGAASVLAGVEGGPAASKAVTSAVSAIQTGVTALSGLVTDFGATPSVASVATALATNASALLAAAKVTNPTSVKAANAIVTNLTSLAGALSGAAPAAPAA
jgi:O6-methylguanine-DNA--protein-cysteine methyltransferase